MYEPCQSYQQIKNEYNENHNYSDIPEKIKLLKQFLENALINAIKNVNDPHNINIIGKIIFKNRDFLNILIFVLIILIFITI